MLVGMRAVTAKIVGGKASGSFVAMNIIGSVTQNTSTCTNLTLNYLAGDYIESMTLSTTTYGVSRIVLVSNNGTSLSRGSALTGSTS